MRPPTRSRTVSGRLLHWNRCWATRTAILVILRKGWSRLRIKSNTSLGEKVVEQSSNQGSNPEYRKPECPLQPKISELDSGNQTFLENLLGLEKVLLIEWKALIIQMRASLQRSTVYKLTMHRVWLISGNEERYFPGLTHPDRPLECSASPVHRWRILAYKTQPSEKEEQSEQELAVGVSEWPSQSLSNCVIQWNDGICCVWRCLVKPTDRSKSNGCYKSRRFQGQDLRNI